MYMAMTNEQSRMEAYASVENNIKEILERDKNGKQAN